ncbi:UNVERIFIED_CONTAM: hypothetical protein FKN15_030364 [Acipenser sinensis]
MEKGLQFGNLSISLVLLLLLKALTGTSHNSAEGKPGPVAARVETGEDGASAMERGLENVGAAAAFGDVTVEDDENGAAGEEDDTTAESSGDGKLKSDSEWLQDTNESWQYFQPGLFLWESVRFSLMQSGRQGDGETLLSGSEPQSGYFL